MRHRPVARARAVLAVGVVALLGVAFLAFFPARAYLGQQRERQRLAAEAEALSARNRALEQRARQLETDAEVERLARGQYNLVRPGEESFAVFLPPTPPPDPAPHAGERRLFPDDPGWGQRIWDRVASLF